MTARAPITPPTMRLTGVEFLDIGREVLDCVELGYRPVEDEGEVGDELEVEVELFLEIVVEVVFSMIEELNPDNVVDFDNDTVSMTGKCSSTLPGVGCRYWNHSAGAICAIAPDSLNSQPNKNFQRFNKVRLSLYYYCIY
jgi:hypothetical protein